MCVINGVWSSIINCVFLFFFFPFAGKSGNSKDICGDDKQKEDGDPWNEAQAAFLGPNLWDKTLPYDADLKVHQVSICTSLPTRKVCKL